MRSLALLLAAVLAVGAGLSWAPTASADTVCVNTTGVGGCHTSIQAAINAANPGDTITIAAGTYDGQIRINKADITLDGDGSGVVTITNSAGTAPLGGNGIIYFDQVDNITLQGFTVQGTGASAQARYGISAFDAENVTVNDVVSQNNWRTGFNFHATPNSVIMNASSLNNGGAGFGFSDVKGLDLTNITTAGNPWGGIGFFNFGRYSPIGTDDVVISGTNSFGESGDDNGGLYLESANFNDPDNPLLITYSTNPADNANVTFQLSDFSYSLHGEHELQTLSDDPNPGTQYTYNYVRFYSSASDAVDAALGDPDHFLPDDRYLVSETDGSFHVGAGMSIQAAIDAAADGDTINVAPGTYTEPLNIDGRSNLTLIGQDRATTIVKPASTLTWGVGTPPQVNRPVAVRVVNSSNIQFSHFTFDMDTIKAAAMYGVLVFDSTGGFDDNVFQYISFPDASSGYQEIMAYVNAPGFSDGARANVTFTNNQFVDAGRVGILTHGFAHTTIQGNTLTKVADDFGYGMEIGSQSTAAVTDNTISGYDTPAASDGSSAAGIYVENAFTNASPAVLKPVTIGDNEIFGNQFGIVIGNEFNNFAGPVDIQVTLTNNNIHDNTDGGVNVADEDRSNGSSVTLNASGNTLSNNGASGAGYFFYTFGDGEIHASLSNETITGHGYGIATGIFGAPNNSLHDITITNSDLSGNTNFGIENTVPEALDAANNWWGAASGPSGEGPGSGDAVSANVTFSPWCADAACATEASENDEGAIEVPAGDTPEETADNAQAVIDDAPSGSVIVLPAGTLVPNGGFVVNTPGLTIVLSDGTVIQASSPCFTVNADDTTITSAGLGGVCQPSGGDHGIQTGADVSGLVIIGVEIDGSATSTGDGIHIAHNVSNLRLVDNYIHDMDGDGVEYAATASVSGVHEVQGNLFFNNAGDGLNNQTGASFNVAYNAWGDLGGPATGDGITGINPADYTPWTHASLSGANSGTPMADKVGVGHEITFTVSLEASELFGADFDLLYDSTRLSVARVITTTTFEQVGSCTVSVSPGVVSFCGQSTTAVNGAAVTMMDVVFTGVSAGGVNLDFDDSDDTFGMLPALGASTNVYGSGHVDALVTVFGTFSVDGRVDLQGRADDSGAVLTFAIGDNQGYGPFAFSTSDFWGTIAASDVVEDTYGITVAMDRYLDVTSASGRSASISMATTLNTLVLLGGDADDDDSITISDAAIIGGEYGNSGGGIADARADINNDGTVNLLDLVLAGGNFGKDSATAYLSWTP